MLGNEDQIAWLIPHAAVVRDHGEAAHHWGQLDESCGFRFSADGEDIVVVDRSPEHLLEISDVVLRLLAVSVVHSLLVRLPGWTSPDLFINAPALAYLMEQCQSLKALSLKNLKMDESH
jgi:hypothetical protein